MSLEQLSKKYLFLTGERVTKRGIMTDLRITFRTIEERDNRELADLIRTVFRESAKNLEPAQGTTNQDPALLEGGKI